ncbi:MAG: VanZ family protein [Lyngbya sp. HA4199-MV5]|jgi:VanZ family protein|nr:VanZ family protein [Lyngbya sp. HA4199-MV5]
MKSQTTKASRLGWRLVAGLYASLFLITLFLAYTGNLPSQLGRIPFYDKIGHVVLYSMATYLGQRVLGDRRIRLWAIAVPLFPFLFAIGTVTEELLQMFSPNRTLDAIDLVASGLGIVLGYWLAARGR